MDSMKSYIFKTSCGSVGYFQHNGEDCKLYVSSEYVPLCENKSWSDWKQFIESGYENAPESSHEHPVSRAVSYFLWQHCERVSADVSEFHESCYRPGTFFPRINRDSSNLYLHQISSTSFVDEVRAFYNVIDTMEDIFKVVEPTRENLKTYGHRIREVLTIACTEVEYLFLQALKSNGYKDKSQYKTTDFVSLLNVYKLSEYEVELKMHPKLGRIKPFELWDENKPTQSLFWYSAYNASKHDRGGSFDQASIEAMVNAIAAIHILLEAQYGSKIFDKPLYSQYESCFHTRKSPTWNVKDMLAPYINEKLKVVWDCESEYFGR
ncbi:hypothetical protein H4F04_18740 [Vibrio scophthalmi]|uniref:hypothetical protein n=1 Tax=Vibrio scophthalmi TaxID=45658 RepID=UPI002FF3EF77